MACKDCLLNCPDIISDQCVQYTGPDIDSLGICQGDPLSTFEAAIVERLLSFSDGSGIVIDDLVTSGCSFMSNQLGALPKSLLNVLQILWDTGCTLKEMIDEIDESIANNPVFNTACLSGLPSNPTRDDILQAAVNLICSIKTTVDAIPSTYVKLSDLTTLVTQIVNNINSGGGSTPQNNAKMVPYSVMAYFGPLSNFDSGGAGISSLGFEKIYLCNGQNGTPDLRGRVIVGAIRNVPGGGLDTAVDPALNPNNPNWALNDKQGTAYHTLTIPQMPAHTHGITDPGDRHNFTYGLDSGGNRFSSNWMKHDANTASKQTQTNTTGITINSAGGGQPHNNIQPSIAGYYIMYIP